MTSTNDIPKVTPKLVLFFDLCSSTTILEDLLRSERQKHWRDLIIELKNFLLKEKKDLNFEIYKFIGDGWILLFEPNCSAEALFGFMQRLCMKHGKLFNNKIAGALSSDAGNVGISFGLEKGSLMRMVMNSKTEYTSRALNVAARLQGALKDTDSKPQTKVLMSNNVFEDFKDTLLDKFQICTVLINLRNISGSENYHAKKLHLFSGPIKKFKK